MGFSIYVVLLYAVRGSKPFTANGTTLPAVILSYIAWALVGGSMIGISLPLARSKWGAALVGSLGMVPLYGIVMFTASGFSPMDVSDAVAVIGLSLFVGSLSGMAFYSMFKK